MIEIGSIEIYNIVYTSIFLLSALILIYLRNKNIHSKHGTLLDKNSSKGILYLSLGLIFWGLIGFFQLAIPENPFNITFYLSTINNAFFLFSIPLLSSEFSVLKSRSYWNITVIILSILSIMIFMLLGSNAGNVMDLIITLITYLGLGYVLFNAFKKRDLSLFGYLTIFAIGIKAISVVFFLVNTFDYTFNFPVFINLVTSIILNIVFIVFAFSWLMESHNSDFNNIFSSSNDDIQKKILEKNFSFEETRERFLNKLVKDEIEEVTEELLTYFETVKNKAALNEISSIAAFLSRYNTQRLKGTIKSEEYFIARSKVRKEIIDLIRNNLYPFGKTPKSNG